MIAKTLAQWDVACGLDCPPLAID